MGRQRGAGQKQGKGEGEADHAVVGGQAHQAGEGNAKKGKGYGKADNGGYEHHGDNGKGSGKSENGWKGHGKNGRGAVDKPEFTHSAPDRGMFGNDRRAKGGGKTHGGRGGKGEAKKPLELSLPKHEEATSTPPHPSYPQLWPITPLGLPRTPPPLPPANLQLGGFFMPTLEPAAEDLPSPSLPSDAKAGIGLPPGTLLRAPEREDEGYTPVAEQQSRMDRRQFFHTEGRPLAYNPAKPVARKPVNASDRLEIGEELNLKVEEVHFGNPRVRIRVGEPAPMPEILKWPLGRFDEHVLDCAEIDFGDYRVWSAIGIRSNRLLYAMKRQGVERLKAVVVPPPVPEAEDDVDMTYGASIQAIQLVP